MKTIKSVIIVGGGSAGWMTAATLQSQFPNWKITLIESKNISTVGVGESTIENVQKWVKLLNINEKDFLKYVDGSFKLSIKFTDFYKKGESFHYPFSNPKILPNGSMNDWWYKKGLYQDTANSDYADCMYPKQMAYVNQNKYNEKLNHAYHFDATKFGLWLRDYYCKNINHIIEDVKTIEQNEEGIVSLNNQFKADLFIDCTGFKSLLLGKTLNEPFESYTDMLPNDSAWATKLDYTDKEKQLTSYTNCTAIENGWVWNIPLWSRIGTGYVYSSQFVDDEQALKEFKKHLNKDDIEAKLIKMRVGIHKRIWVKNVVAIGLSAGFIEPLESNGLFSVIEFLMKFIFNLRREKVSQWDIDNFNFSCKRTFKVFAEFVALHYALSHRDDTKYWKSCMEKNWNTGLLNLNAPGYNGFLGAILQREESKAFDRIGGLHCIAAGMNWSPIDMPLLKTLDIDFNYINNQIILLEQQKLNANIDVRNEKNLYQYLKESIYNN